MDILIGIFIVLAVIGLYFIRMDSRKIKAAFTRLALKHDGIVRKVVASYPKLEFEHDGKKIEVSVTHGTNGPFTHLSCDVSHRTEVSEFIIISRDMPTKVMMTRNDLKNHKNRDNLFDSKFISRSHDVDSITSWLSPEVKEKLLELGDGKCTEVRFLKSRDSQTMYRFDLHVEQILTEYRDYEKLINTALQILQSLESSLYDSSAS